MLWTEIAFSACLAWHWPDRHWQCNNTSGVDVFAHVCGQKADTSSNYCDSIQPYDKRRFSFCQMWYDFRLFLVEITTNSNSKFRKVMRQHTEVMVGSMVYFSLQQWKNSENPLRIDKVIAMSLVYYFFGTQCIAPKSVKEQGRVRHCS